MGLASLLVLLIVAGGTWFVGRGLDAQANQDANLRARSDVALLVTVGSKIPAFTPGRLSRGLTHAESRSLDRAVLRAQRAGLLANLYVWDRTGRIVYGPVESREGTRPRLEPDVVQALGGRRVTREHPREFDDSARRRSGVLDAFVPLRDDAGRVYGAVESSLPLAPIRADSARIRQRMAFTLVGAALLLWLLALPVVIRVARSWAAQWSPGRRRRLSAFKRALARREIEMVYQPQVDPAGGRVHAIEALVRWRSRGSLLAPAAFLPEIESSPLMARLTDRALELALAELRRCEAAGHRIRRVSVNCSATDLADPTFPARLTEALARSGVAGARLTLELTETAILNDPTGASELFTAITALGVEIAIDDFGTGHASIARLHGLPVSEVKIDRSFMTADDRSRTYVSAIIGFARSLGLRVVAEGVEDEATMALLRDRECDLAQGFHVARPMESADLAGWLDANAAHTVH